MDVIILKSFIPESFLSLSILFQLIFNIRIINNLKYNFCILDKETFGQTFFILFCLIGIYSNLKIEGFFSNFIFLNDSSTIFVKLIFVLICIFVLNIISKTFSIQKLNFFEFFTIFLLAILSLLLLISSCDLISFYLLIEMQSLCFYVLASFNRNSSFSTEAGLKYFVSGAFISGIFLFGCSLLYGALGTLNFNHLNILLSFSLDSFNLNLYYLIVCGIVCITSTLLFKISCAPFHFWSPDVYDGSPLSSTVVFSVLPKLPILYFFFRWISCLDVSFESIQYSLLIFGVFSVFFGTFMAISQKRLKKLIIYSSIAQVGFIVCSLSINTLEGYSFFLFFLFIYLVTSIAIWGLFSSFYSSSFNVNLIEKRNLSSLFLSSISVFFRINHIWGFVFVIIFFSIGGIPPLTGFLSKAFILFSVLCSGNVIASVFLILISSISVFYYIRIIKIVFFEPQPLNNKYEKFQVVFFDTLLDSLYLSIYFFLTILLLFFFNPTFLILIGESIILDSFFY